MYKDIFDRFLNSHKNEILIGVYNGRLTEVSNFVEHVMYPYMNIRTFKYFIDNKHWNFNAYYWLIILYVI